MVVRQLRLKGKKMKIKQRLGGERIAGVVSNGLKNSFMGMGRTMRGIFRVEVS